MPLKDETLLVSLGRDPDNNYGCVNTAIYRASTISHQSMDILENGDPSRPVRYGRYGTPTVRALEEAVAKLEGGSRAVAVSSGKAAVASALMTFCEQGDHILVADSVYGPTRSFASGYLTRMGISVTYFDPCMGERVETLFQKNTRLIFAESPGSLTFEVMDIPAMARVAHRNGALMMMDNTWGTPLYFKSFKHGVDVSIHAGTKYIVGHSDVMLGLVVTTPALEERVVSGIHDFGASLSPDDAFLALRGLRTMDVRLERHEKNMLTVARWLRDRPEVAEVMCPALPEDPHYALWRRDFTGSSGLFGIRLHTDNRDAVAAMIDDLHHFGMGYSWGGYESLVVPQYPDRSRTAVPYTKPGYVLRFHIGLEHPDDLIDDLSAGLDRLNQVISRT